MSVGFLFRLGGGGALEWVGVQPSQYDDELALVDSQFGGLLAEWLLVCQKNGPMRVAELVEVTAARDPFLLPARFYRHVAQKWLRSVLATGLLQHAVLESEASESGGFVCLTPRVRFSEVSG